jgi:hypothetical protein
MDQVVLRHLDICFGVHMAVVVACVVYVTAKIQQTPLSFTTVTQVSADDAMAIAHVCATYNWLSCVLVVVLGVGCSAHGRYLVLCFHWPRLFDVSFVVVRFC